MSKEKVAADAFGNRGRRLLKLLSKSVRSGVSIYPKGANVVLNLNGKELEFKRSLLAKAEAHGFLAMGDHTITITRLGLDYLSCQKEPVTNIGAAAKGPAKSRLPQFNDEESPLFRLYKRRFANGKKYLTEDEFAAGERLRRDFECGQLQPSISANLFASIGRSGKNGNFDSIDISDFALDARSRFQSAVRSIGPELADIAIDVCCFLKGFELVEREKQWPPRSAKLMLKTALAQLSRHYGLSADHPPSSGDIRSWGEEGYRPGIS